jgi:hypothetical protein
VLTGYCCRHHLGWPSAVVEACWLGVCMDWHTAWAGVRVMLRIARRAVVAPCTALRYIGNRNGSEITTMRGKRSRGWIDLLLPTTGSKQVDEHDLARGGPGFIVSFDFDSKRT